jgi:hypothetical protein
MKYNITTKQGNNYIVSDDPAWLWITLERDLGYTLTQAQEKMSQGSLEVITYILYLAAVGDEHTDYKTHQGWVENEFDTFDVVSDDPKDTPKEASKDT